MVDGMVGINEQRKWGPGFRRCGQALPVGAMAVGMGD